MYSSYADIGIQATLPQVAAGATAPVVNISDGSSSEPEEIILGDKPTGPPHLQASWKATKFWSTLRSVLPAFQLVVLVTAPVAGKLQLQDLVLDAFRLAFKTHPKFPIHPGMIEMASRTLRFCLVWSTDVFSTDCHQRALIPQSLEECG